MTEHGATMTCTILFVVSKRAHKDIVLRALNVSRERVHHRKVAGAEVAQISLGPNRCFAVTVCQSADPNARLEKVRKLHAKVKCNAIVMLNCWLHLAPEDNRTLPNVMLCNSFEMYRDIAVELFQGWGGAPMEDFRPIFAANQPVEEEAEVLQTSVVQDVQDLLTRQGLVNMPEGAAAAGRNILAGLDDAATQFGQELPPGGALAQPGMVQWTTPSTLIMNRGQAPPGAAAWNGSPFFAVANNEQMERFASDRRRKDQGRFGRGPNGVPDGIRQGPAPAPSTRRFEAYHNRAAAAPPPPQPLPAYSELAARANDFEGSARQDYNEAPRTHIQLGRGTMNEDEMLAAELEAAEEEHAATVFAQRPAPAPSRVFSAPRARTLAERLDERRRSAAIEKNVGSKASAEVKKKVTRLRAEDKEIAAIPTTADENRCMICLDRHVMACAMPCLCFKFCITCLQTIEKAAKNRMDRPRCPACQQEFTSFIQPRCHVNPEDEFDRMQSLYKNEPWRYYEERAAALEESAKEMRTLAEQERQKKSPDKKDDEKKKKDEDESPSKKSKTEH